MLNWLRKLLAPPAAPLRERQSLFSTDVNSVNRRPSNWETWLKYSFQKTTIDLKPDGPQSAGMDAAIADLKTNSDTPSFAMDSPNAGNPMSMTGLTAPFVGIPFTQLCWYASRGFIGYQLCAMVAQHWLVNKVCEMPGRDAMSNGYELSSATEGEKLTTKQIKEIRKLDVRYRLHHNCVEAIKYMRVFGIRVVMFKIKTNDPLFYEQPFNIDGIKKGSYLGISQIDPYWMSPLLDTEAVADPSAIHFYEPTWWVINGKKIHRTHLVILRNSDVADILKPTYLYGGIPIPQMICERVYAAERTANEAPMLALTKRLYVQKMDMAAAMANQELLNEKLQWQNDTRDNFGTLAIGIEDEADQLDTTLTDLDEVIMSQFYLVCAAGNVPVTEIMETPPKGFNTTGEFSTHSYDRDLKTIQANDIQQILDRHYELLEKSEGTPAVENTWNPIDTPNAKEQADINKVNADTGAVLVTSGAILGSDERKRIIGDKDSGYNQLEDIIPGGPGDVQAELDRMKMDMEADQEGPDTTDE